MLDAPTDRTGVTSAALPRARQYDAEEGPERRSVAGPFRPWLIASYVINVLPLKTKVKHGVPCSPCRNRPFELEITFCVRGVLSPLLSNLVLDELDRELKRRGHQFVRYADDCNIYVSSERAGQRVMAGVTRFLTEKLKLKVNQEKSAVARPWQRKFLGFSFTSHRLPKRRIAPKSRARYEQKIRKLTRRTRGVSLAELIREMGSYMRGWRSYFQFCETPSVLKELQSWPQV